MDYKQDKVGFAQPVKPDLDIDLESLEDLPEKCSFFDAVTLEVEQSTPVLLLQITDLIDKFWVNGNYTKFRRVADCPLFGQFEECMGHVFSIETVKQLFHNGWVSLYVFILNKYIYMTCINWGSCGGNNLLTMFPNLLWRKLLSWCPYGSADPEVTNIRY